MGRRSCTLIRRRNGLPSVLMKDMVDWLVVVVNRIHNDLMKLIVSII